jgi:hypothetical protein
VELSTSTTTPTAAATVRTRWTSTVQVKIESRPGWEMAEGVIGRDTAFLRKMIPLFVSQ